jgi:hypothetical protein
MKPSAPATLAFALAWALVVGNAAADELAEDDGVSGVHLGSSVAVRAAPLGLVMQADAGYRLGLSSSDSPILSGTYFEPGVTTQLTPSSAKAGLFLEALPLAILQLRVSAQALSYLGTWGYLHLPPDPDDPEGWSLSQLGGSPTEGRSGTGVMLEAKATPRALVGRTVFLAETKLRWARVGVDQAYYEPSFDMLLEPSDSYWVTRPTLGQVFALPERDSWIMAALRWEHGRSHNTNVVRDMAAVVGLWKLPWSVRRDGEMVLAVVGGYWARHPNRQGTVYVASQLSIDWSGL